jgi:alpha-mannosidase
MHIGHQFLKNEFGIKPRVGWMIDAFGHSEANAALFADFGFEALFFSRIGRNERESFKRDKKMTFLWEPNSAYYGSSKRILTHVFQNHYNGPFGSKDAMIPYKSNIEYNLDHRCVSLQNWA